MHILEIPSYFPPMGGAFCLDQAKALQACGHEVRIVSVNQYGLSLGVQQYLKARRGRWWERLEGIEVYRTTMHAVPRRVRYNQRRWCSIVESMYHEYVRQYGRPDVLHAHCAQWAGVAARQIGEKENIPYFISEHTPKALFEAEYGAGWSREPWARVLLQECYENASCVIPVAGELVGELSPVFGKDYRWQAVSNTIDLDYFALRERKSGERPFRFCCLGNANGAELQRKGFDVLSKAMEKVREGELHIAGQGTDSAEMQQLFPHATLHGKLNREDVRDLLYQSDALVLASRSEVQPLVLLEAMATGIPCVSTECIPKSERLDSGCIIAPIGDAEALAQAMQQVMHRQWSPTAMRQDVERLASPLVVGRQLTELFTKKQEDFRC